jgi:hypothetical protein
MHSLCSSVGAWLLQIETALSIDTTENYNLAYRYARINIGTIGFKLDLCFWLVEPVEVYVWALCSLQATATAVCSLEFAATSMCCAAISSTAAVSAECSSICFATCWHICWANKSFMYCRKYM